jgi:hypothetical protein
MNVGTCCHGEVQSNGGSKGKPALPEVEGKRPRDKIEKGALLELDDSDDDIKGRNKEKPEGNKKAKERTKLEAEAANLSNKIEEMVKSKEVYMDKALQAKMAMTDKKNAINQTRWETI